MMAGQTINDRFLAARHSLAGQGLAKAVCKATTEEMIAPKRKHLDYLVHCTNEPNISIPQMATLLIERSQHANWVVVYKALITTHHLMCYGNERFTQYMASSNSTFQLTNFLDKSGVQGILSGKAGYDMSPFIRRYARYLNEKAVAYRTVAFDFCKVKRGKDDGTLRTMGTDRLLKTLPTLQAQVDALLEFDCSANDLTNSVINVCFMLLFRDLIRLFACYNDAIINLLEKYFDMNKKQCREALDLYKKFLVRMDRVSEFLKVAENIGIDKGDIPDLTKAPNSLLDALEQHLLSLEGTKKAATSATQAASNARNVRKGVGLLSTTSTAFGTAVTNSESDDFGQTIIDDAIRQKVLAEEEAILNQYKAKVQSPSDKSIQSSNNSSSAVNNPFLSSSSTSEKTNFSTPQSSVDLSSAGDDFFSSNTANTNSASYDLLQLNNPFADAFDVAPQRIDHSNILTAPASTAPFAANNVWMHNNNNGLASPVQQTNNINTGVTPFVPESAFTTAFSKDQTTSSNNTIDNNPRGDFDTNSINTNPFLAPSSEESSYPSNDDQVDANSEPIENCVNGYNCSNNLNYRESQTPPSSPLVQTDSNRPTTVKTESVVDDLIDTTTVNENSISDPSQESPSSKSLPQDLLELAEFDMNGSAKSSSKANNNNSGGLLTGDLDSSLASLAENLSINNRAIQPKGVWNSPKNGATNWTPQPMAATNGSGYKPMGQGMATTPTLTMPPSPYQPQIAMVRTAPIGLVQPLNVQTSPIYPHPTMQQTASVAGTNPASQSQTLLFH